MMKKAAQTLLVLFALFVALLLMVNLHEIGHTLAARLFGDRQAVYYLYKSFPNGRVCFGCNIYDEKKLSTLGNVLVTVAGLLVTQFFVVDLLFLRKIAPLKPLMRRLVNVFILVLLLDLPVQLIQGLAAPTQTQTSLTWVDLADFNYLVSSPLDVSTSVIKIGLALAAGLYLYGLYATFVKAHD